MVNKVAVNIVAIMALWALSCGIVLPQLKGIEAAAPALKIMCVGALAGLAYFLINRAMFNLADKVIDPSIKGTFLAGLAALAALSLTTVAILGVALKATGLLVFAGAVPVFLAAALLIVLSLVLVFFLPD